MSDRVPHASVTIAAQAKINLRLKVIAREASGYHTIETIFHKLTLADHVTVSLHPSPEQQITCTVDVGPAEQNLAFRAAQAFCNTAGWHTGFTIHIEKKIPARGGLGGGSADAAATLRALNTLAPTPLPTDALLHIAATLGADVPFLTSDATMALAWGHGDHMLACDPLPQRYVALVIPPFGIDTAEAYQWIDDLTPSAPTAPVLLHPWHIANWNELTPWATNDFEAVASARHPLLTQSIATLRDHGATLAAMTGSGSVLFGIFSTPPNADAITHDTHCQVLITQTALTTTAPQHREVP